MAPAAQLAATSGERVAVSHPIRTDATAPAAALTATTGRSEGAEMGAGTGSCICLALGENVSGRRVRGVWAGRLLVRLRRDSALVLFSRQKRPAPDLLVDDATLLIERHIDLNAPEAASPHDL